MKGPANDMPPVGDNGDNESLRESVLRLEAELRQRNEYVQRLEKANRDLEKRVQEASESAQPAAELTELEEALKRLVARSP
jgi:predicted RNase H-like nuclease (RuvC/YqgF family)